MRVFWSFVYKEALHIFRDVRTMLFVLLIPVILMLVFGFAISTEVNNVDVRVVAPVPGTATQRVVDQLQANPYFTFKGYAAPNEVDRYLRSGDTQAVIIFSSTYEKDVQQLAQGVPLPPPIQVVLDASNTNTAVMATHYLESLLTEEAAAQQSLFSTHLRHNPQMKSSYNFVPGIMGLIFILICALMTSVSIVREKEAGTMEVLLVSPIKPFVLVVAKMVPYFLLSCVNMVTILLIAHYILEVPLAGGVWGVVVLSVLYILLALALGLFVSTLAKTQLAALVVSAVIMLIPMMLLSGMFYPLENLPPVLLESTVLVPARWYNEAVRKMMIAGVPFKMVLKEFFILLGMTAFFMGVSLLKFNDKLE